MSEQLVAARAVWNGPAGPEMLRIPAEPQRLRQAVQQLRELAQTLTTAGEELAGSEGRHEDRKGSTTSTVMAVARWNGRRLVKDGGLLDELAGAAEHEAQLLGDAQSHDLPSLRQRWNAAQDQFVSELRQINADAAQRHEERQREQRQQEEQRAAQQGGGQHGGRDGRGDGRGDGGRRGDGRGEGRGDGRGDGERVAAEQVHWQDAGPAPKIEHPQQLMHSIDEELVRHHDDLFRRLLGAQVHEGGGGGGRESMLIRDDGRLDQAISGYRQTVRGILEEFAELVQRVRQAERAIEEHETFPRADRDDERNEGGEGGAIAAGGLVSAFPVLRELVTDLQNGAKAHDHAFDRLPAIAAALRDGQLPDRGRQQEPGEGFKQEWQRHFGNRRDRLRTVSQRVDDVLERFQRIDAEAAAAIRAH